MKTQIESHKLAAVIASKMLLSVGRESMRGDAGKDELERLMSNIKAVGLLKGERHENGDATKCSNLDSDNRNS